MQQILDRYAASHTVLIQQLTETCMAHKDVIGLKESLELVY